MWEQYDNVLQRFLGVFAKVKDKRNIGARPSISSPLGHTVSMSEAAEIIAR